MNLPTVYTFKPGEAVYYVIDPTRMHANRILEQAMVVSVSATMKRRGPAWVGILGTSSPKVRRVDPSNLVWRGYCEACTLPAVVSGEQLICPQCAQPAIDAIAPDPILLQWAPWGWALTQRAAREQIRIGTYHEAWEYARKCEREAWQAACQRVGVYASLGYIEWETDPEASAKWHARQEAQAWALIGDDAAFLDAYLRAGGYTPQARENLERFLDMVKEILENRDDLPPPRPRPDAPALRIVRPADDSEPSGDDATTRWLEQQFKRAA